MRAGILVLFLIVKETLSREKLDEKEGALWTEDKQSLQKVENGEVYFDWKTNGEIFWGGYDWLCQMLLISHVIRELRTNFWIEQNDGYY